jgi:hypothetical protein
MDELDELYVRREIQRALTGHEESGRPLRMQIMGDVDHSRWLLVTATQVRAIRELVATDTPDLAAVAAILAEVEGDA